MTQGTSRPNRGVEHHQPTSGITGVPKRYRVHNPDINVRERTVSGKSDRRTSEGDRNSSEYCTARASPAKQRTSVSSSRASSHSELGFDLTGAFAAEDPISPASSTTERLFRQPHTRFPQTSRRAMSEASPLEEDTSSSHYTHRPYATPSEGDTVPDTLRMLGSTEEYEPQAHQPRDWHRISQQSLERLPQPLPHARSQDYIIDARLSSNGRRRAYDPQACKVSGESQPMFHEFSAPIGNPLNFEPKDPNATRYAEQSQYHEPDGTDIAEQAYYRPEILDEYNQPDYSEYNPPSAFGATTPPAVPPLTLLGRLPLREGKYDFLAGNRTMVHNQTPFLKLRPPTELLAAPFMTMENAVRTSISGSECTMTEDLVEKASQFTLTSEKERARSMEKALIHKVMIHPLGSSPLVVGGNPVPMTLSFVVHFFQMCCGVIMIALTAHGVNADTGIAQGIWIYLIFQSCLLVFVSMMFMVNLMSYDHNNGIFYCLVASILSVVGFGLSVGAMMPASATCLTGNANLCTLRRAVTGFAIIMMLVWLVNLVSFITIFYISRLNLINELNFDAAPPGEFNNGDVDPGRASVFRDFDDINEDAVLDKGLLLHDTGSIREVSKNELVGRKKIILYT
ncbi:hypothetical protein BABINDRAFT_163653 [Babjeviella inositovora NRRL Y-12698]|uniref:MARVEL domain-containing protein n=1 Tax=Babjeviella inositovora NRRL Y-12698 TaxID=984486 RepID=A0A1E3QIH8_9ASCO|nr:uncharacterized protein BABINDRAFT_163653 [Babjeviella inositovora NRRL Y-12698]ODQ77408.1 hypothetical protein BABINDRAFT_163653 [Babjeviella inositovora NRRL Y-12698]